MWPDGHDDAEPHHLFKVGHAIVEAYNVAEREIFIYIFEALVHVCNYTAVGKRNFFCSLAAAFFFRNFFIVL
jgi:hypothetical protein